MDVDADGDFSFEIGPGAGHRRARDPRLPGRPAGRAARSPGSIEALDEPDPIRHGDAETAAALRASAAWLRTMFMIIPLDGRRPRRGRSTPSATRSRTPPTRWAPPYQVPDANFGWSARDACYSFGSYDLAEDEALVDHAPAAAMPLLEHVRLEPVHGHPQRRRRPDARSTSASRRAQPRRHGHDRDQPRPVVAPQRADHDRLPARQPGVPLVPGRRTCRSRPRSRWSSWSTRRTGS